jgi:hypothetical protein
VEPETDYDSSMALEVRDLPEVVAKAAAKARAAMSAKAIVPLDTSPLDPRISAWAESVILSGALDQALLRVADSDPDLAN